MYNLTEIQVRRVRVNNNRLKVRFNEQRDTIEVAQDDIDLEVQLRYRIVSRPPVMVDAGVIRVTVDDLSFNGEVQIDPNNQGKLQISVKDL